ncbi:MAG: hypothetical protein DMG09_11330 [Acidobacteria bacterium]|nr:MAG: hypothetical protein DMG09_11330 [Acidobacteriota bacterium]
MAAVGLDECRDLRMPCQQLAPVVQERTPLAVPQRRREAQLVSQPPAVIRVPIAVGQYIRAVELLVKVRRLDGWEEKPPVFAKGIMQFWRGEDALRRGPAIHAQQDQRAVAMIRPLAEETLQPDLVSERICGVERLEELRVHAQQFHSLFEVGHDDAKYGTQPC